MLKTEIGNNFVFRDRKPALNFLLQALDANGRRTLTLSDNIKNVNAVNVIDIFETFIEGRDCSVCKFNLTTLKRI